MHIGEVRAGLWKVFLAIGRNVPPMRRQPALAGQRQPPQQRSAVGEDVQRRIGPARRLDMLFVDRKRTVEIAFVEVGQRDVPGKMPVQEALAIMRRHPLCEKFSAHRHVALLEHRMREAMRGVGVFGAQRHGALGQCPAGGEITRLGMRPAEVTDEPPVLAIVPRVAFADRKLGGIVVGTARERVEAERAEQDRQYLRVARIFFEMRLGAGHGDFRLALDHGGHDLDMAFFALARGGRQFAGLSRHGARLAAFHVELMQPGAADMRQRKARILRDRLVEGVLGAVPGRQQAVDAVAVMRRGAIRGGGQQKIVSVPVHVVVLGARRGWAKPSRGRAASTMLWLHVTGRLSGCRSAASVRPRWAGRSHERAIA